MSYGADYDWGMGISNHIMNWNLLAEGGRGADDIPVAIVLSIGVFGVLVVIPIGIFLLAWAGKIDLKDWFKVKCPRCGGIRHGRFCANCGQEQGLGGGLTLSDPPTQHSPAHNPRLRGH